jgi:ATP-dependent DNA ligase
MLRNTVQGAMRILYASHIEDTAAPLWVLAKRFDLEGVIAKDGSSRHIAGRSDRWQKIKTAAGAERERERRPK